MLADAVWVYAWAMGAEAAVANWGLVTDGVGGTIGRNGIITGRKN